MPLTLSVAIGDYDRNRPLLDRKVVIDGVEAVTMTLSPEEMFFRAMRQEAFDICELSLSSFALRRDRGDCPYVGVPAFLSRAFRHTSIIVRRGAGIERPKDLEGRHIGVAEWQLTANVWARALLEDHGVDLKKITWVRGGLDEPGRPEKIAVKAPPGIDIRDIGPEQTLNNMLVAGEIDGFIGPRPPSAFIAGHPDLTWLFRDPIAEARSYYQRTRIFPIMHLVGVRKTLVDQHPWLPSAVLKAFDLSKRMAMAELNDSSATKVMLPFFEERLAEARALMGSNYWSYGVEPNRHVLDAFLQAHHAQGLSNRRLGVDDLFHSSTYDTVKV
jgi:4,5-dihydroxyphthalate decarboxylase